MKKTMSDLVDDQGVIHCTNRQKIEAFQNHHLVYKEDNQEEIVNYPKRGKRTEDRTLVQEIRKLLAKTKDTQPGPDMISYKLLKQIKDTALGQSILNNVASMIPTESRQAFQIPQHLLSMQMVMIPKPGKDITKVKWWRPIVLSNYIAKLSEKVVAERIQRIKEVFHRLQFGNLKTRLAIDSMMGMKAVIRETYKKGRYS